MKKLSIILTALLIMTLAGAAAQAASSANRRIVKDPESGQNYIIYEITADAADGSIDAITTPLIKGYVTQVEIIPGATAFTASALDLVVQETFQGFDSNAVFGSGDTYTGGDILGGQMTDISNTEATRVRPKSGVSFVDLGVYVNSPLKLTFTGNVVNSAKFIVKIVYY